jgi:GH24 family phage-related lysozyme (muramidase)
MRSLVLIALVCGLLIFKVSSQCSEDQTIQNEGGIQNYCYNDSVGQPTIGIGYWLGNGDAAQQMSNAGLDLNAVLNDCADGTQTQYLSDDAATNIFESDSYDTAINCVSGYAPGQPPTVTAALVDMAFNLGCGGLNQFQQMLADLNAGNYQQAAADAQNSKWCGQVGNRCAIDAACIASGQAPVTPLKNTPLQKLAKIAQP